MLHFQLNPNLWKDADRQCGMHEPTMHLAAKLVVWLHFLRNWIENLSSASMIRPNNDDDRGHSLGRWLLLKHQGFKMVGAIVHVSSL
jgi:hypothetical protein